MRKLLFVPLFHDSSFLGRSLSLMFRLARITWGILAYLLIVLILFTISIIWFVTPIALITSLVSQFVSLPFVVQNLTGLSYIFPVFAIGLVLFILHLINRPYKRVIQINTFQDLWQATRLKQSDIYWENLLRSAEVADYLRGLEIKPQLFFADQHIEITENYLKSVLGLAKKSQARFITEIHFWLAMLFTLPNLENELLKINLKKEDFENSLTYFEEQKAAKRKIYIWDADFSTKHLRGTNRGWLGAPTPNLDAISTDLTKVAAREDMEDFSGREEVMSQAVSVLSQEKDRNVLLVGPAGAGKSTLVTYLAKQIIAGDAPGAIATKRLVKLEIAKILSSVTTEGELATKVKNAFEEAQFIENIVIFIDEFHEMGLGDAGKNFNLYSLILPYLESGDFQFIAATEEENYARILEKKSSLLRLFHKIDVPPADIADTTAILKKRAIKLRVKDKVYTSYLAIKEIAEKCSRFIHDRVLPDSALQLFEECKVSPQDGQITVHTVKEVLSKRINVPVIEIDNSQKDLLLNLEQVIHQKLIDQKEAVEKVSDSLRRSATSLRESNRPIGSFLFVGPTGVGKTELAKILSDIYFNPRTNDQQLKTNNFVRFDMSEYQTESAVDRLIGTYDNPGELTEAVKNKPYSLLLLDEFEKANTNILTLFLQVLDDGRLTDGSGKTIDFTNCIIIATSNVGSVLIAEELKNGAGMEGLDSKVREELLHVLKPELINRFDDIVIFKPLSQEDLEKIVALKLEELSKILKEQGFLVEFNSDIKSELAKRGFDPVMGARPLRRTIQDTLEAKLSRLILEGKLKKGEVFYPGIDFFPDNFDNK